MGLHFSRPVTDEYGTIWYQAAFSGRWHDGRGNYRDSMSVSDQQYVQEINGKIYVYDPSTGSWSNVDGSDFGRTESTHPKLKPIADADAEFDAYEMDHGSGEYVHKRISVSHFHDYIPIERAEYRGNWYVQVMAHGTDNIQCVLLIPQTVCIHHFRVSDDRDTQTFVENLHTCHLSSLSNPSPSSGAHSMLYPSMVAPPSQVHHVIYTPPEMMHPSFGAPMMAHPSAGLVGAPAVVPGGYYTTSVTPQHPSQVLYSQHPAAAQAPSVHWTPVQTHVPVPVPVTIQGVPPSHLMPTYQAPPLATAPTYVVATQQQPQTQQYLYTP